MLGPRGNTAVIVLTYFNATDNDVSKTIEDWWIVGLSVLAGLLLLGLVVYVIAVLFGWVVIGPFQVECI